MLGDGDKAGELFSMLNPINHARTRDATFTATRSSPMSSAPMSIPRRRMSGAADGPGTPARPAGCTAPASKGILGFRVAGQRRCARSLHSQGWPGFEIAFRYDSARYEIAVENPVGVCRGVAVDRSSTARTR